MGTQHLVTLGACAGLVVLLGWSIIDTQTDPTPVTFTGQVSAPCSVLDARPEPQVADVDGNPMSGSPWISAPLGSGHCTSTFVITGVPERDRYRVTVGPAVALVPRRMVGAVNLTA